MKEEKSNYEKVISEIKKYEGGLISVIKLSNLLGVSSETINARLRRENANVKTVVRTNYISTYKALELTEVHKYALLNWITLKEASQITNVQVATLKLRCRNGLLEGHHDLTKRIRVDPLNLSAKPKKRKTLEYEIAEEPFLPKSNINMFVFPIDLIWAEWLEPDYAIPPPLEASKVKILTKKNYVIPPPLETTKVKILTDVKNTISVPLEVSKEKILPEVNNTKPPETKYMEVRILTAKDYGIYEPEVIPPHLSKEFKKISGKNEKSVEKYPIFYNPNNPPTKSECVRGSSIKYLSKTGIIEDIFEDDLKRLQIKVRFSEENEDEFNHMNLLIRR